MSGTVSICERCGARIHLVQLGLSFKWVTNPNKPHAWKCGTSTEFPVRSHQPKEQ